jgi:hypothetical protein
MTIEVAAELKLRAITDWIPGQARNDIVLGGRDDEKNNIACSGWKEVVESGGGVQWIEICCKWGWI